MSLHSTVSVIHKLVRWCTITALSVIGLLILIRLGIYINKVYNPPPPDLPTVSFGKLPPIIFPESSVKESFTYSLYTLSGSLPDLPDRVKIYSTVSPSTTLLNIQRARDKAAAINFKDDGENHFSESVLTPTKYEWTVVSKSLIRSLVMDTDTYNFKFSSSYKTYPVILNQSFVNDEVEAKKTAVSFLAKMSLKPVDLDDSKTKIQKMKLKDSILVPAMGIADTQLFKVDYFQKDLEELPVYYQNHPSSSMSFLVMARASETDDVLEGNFYHQSISDKTATYPIKTAQEAYEELQQGKAYIANYFGSLKDIKITDVALGYYIGNSPQQYVMPVIAFQSGETFFAFVSALFDDCLTTSQASIKQCQELRTTSAK